MHFHPRHIQQEQTCRIWFVILVYDLAFVFDETGGRFRRIGFRVRPGKPRKRNRKKCTKNAGPDYLVMRTGDNI